MAEELQTECPLQLSQCFGECCRYYLKYEQRCASEQIKAMERRQREKAEESQAPARRLNGRKVEVVRMQG